MQHLSHGPGLGEHHTPGVLTAATHSSHQHAASSLEKLTARWLAQACQVRHLSHVAGPTDSMGDLVWARITPSLWWAGEALNPLAMPPGRDLPAGATSGEQLQIRGVTCCIASV